MTTDRHMEKARELRNAVNWQSNGSIKHIAAALADVERETEMRFISTLADIRIKSGVGDKPMLSELADVIAARIAEAHADGMRRAAEIVRNGFDRPAGEAWRADGQRSKLDKCPHGIVMYEDCEQCAAAAILSEADTLVSHQPANGDTQPGLSGTDDAQAGERKG